MGKSGSAYEDSLLTWANAGKYVIGGLSNTQGVLSVVKGLQNLLAKLNPPPTAMLTQVASFIPTSWIMMSAKLGIADLLKDGPLTAAEIAAKIGWAREDDLYRALRMLAVHGVYEALPGAKGDPTRFRNNALSATLRSDHPNSVKHLAQIFYDDAYDCFSPAVVEWHLRQPGGSTPPCLFERIKGKDYWEWARENPAAEVVFSQAMAELDVVGLEAVLQDFKWSRFQRVVDIGGANGSIMFGMLQRNPKLQGVLFDQPQVIKRAEKLWEERPAWSKVRGRLSLAGGDFFKPETLPELQDGDAVFLRHVLHDWDHDDSVRILQSVRQAIGSKKVTLTLCELTLEPEFSDSPLHVIRSLADVHMLAMTRGRERTAKQWDEIFNAGGFQLVKVHQTRCPDAIVEGKPI